MEEWEDETAMERKRIEKARSKLRSLGILQEDVRSVPAKLYYRVDHDRLYELLGHLGTDKKGPTVPTSRDQPSLQVRTKGATIKDTETTSETTTESEPVLSPLEMMKERERTERERREAKHKGKGKRTYERRSERSEPAKPVERVSLLEQVRRKAVQHFEQVSRHGGF